MSDAVQHGNDGLATVKEAAEFLSVSRWTIQRLINSGELDTRRLRRMTRITWASLKRYAGLD